MMRYLSIALILGLLAALGLVGADRPAAADQADQAWGAIKGQVVWGGDKVPERKTVNVDKDQNHCLSKGPIPSDELVVNPKNKGLRWVFVWLAPAPPNPKAKLAVHPSLMEIKEKEVVIDQPCCMFIPHAVALREGQDLVAKNSAPIAHNVNWTGHPLKNPGNNVIVPPKQEHTIKGLKADRFPVTISCNIHGWMKAYARVFDHPYFAVTDEDGKFEIKNAPAGDLRLILWHDSGWRGGAAGKDGVGITIKADAVTDLGQLKW